MGKELNQSKSRYSNLEKKLHKLYEKVSEKSHEKDKIAEVFNSVLNEEIPAEDEGFQSPVREFEN